MIERARSGGEATSNVQSLRSAILLDSNAGVVAESRALLAPSAFEQTNLVIGNDGLTKVTKIPTPGEAVTMQRRRCYWPLASEPAVPPR